MECKYYSSTIRLASTALCSSTCLDSQESLFVSNKALCCQRETTYFFDIRVVIYTLLVLQTRCSPKNNSIISWCYGIMLCD